MIIAYFLELILIFLKTPTKTFSLSSTYLSIYLIGFIPTFFYQYFAAILRCYGNTFFQTIAILISTILNAILDPLFIHWMGFKGAVVVTVLTQTLSLIAIYIYTKHKKCFQLSVTSFNKNTSLKIIKKSVPTIIQQSIPAIRTMALTAVVCSYGLSAIAAFGIIGKIENILLYPVMVLNMALTVIIGTCYGSKRKDRINDYLKCGLKYGSLSLFILTLLVCTAIFLYRRSLHD